MKKQTGFSLVELMVVISIIGMLASAALANFGDSRAAARDAKRIQDMNSLAVAFQLFFMDHGRYPGYTEDGVSNGAEFIGVGDDIDDALRPYINPVPRDPSHDGVLYFYSYDPQHRISDKTITDPLVRCDETPWDDATYTQSTHPERYGAVYAFNRLEKPNSMVSQDTCVGGNLNQNNADFNRALRPMPD